MKKISKNPEKWLGQANAPSSELELSFKKENVNVCIRSITKPKKKKKKKEEDQSKRVSTLVGF